MQILKVGDKSQAICPRCDCLVDTTFDLRPVHLEETGTTVENVLVGICDSCGETVTIPPQSTPRLKEARERKTRKLEVRVPHHLSDLLGLVAQEFDVPKDTFAPLLFRYYLHECTESPALANRVCSLAKDDVLSGPKDSRISLRLTDSQWDTLMRAWQACDVSDKSVLLNSVILVAWHDVFQARQNKRRKDLARVAELAG